MSKHGKRNTRLYNVWGLMKNRCNCITNDNYHNYGGRGIKVCDEWQNNFMNFYTWAMKNGYDETAKRGECTLDRIDVNGNYEPSNCRWVNSKIQSNNTRYNRYITYEGLTLTVSQWSDKIKVDSSTIRERLKRGLPIEKVLFPKNLRKNFNTVILQYDMDMNLVKRWECSARQIDRQTNFTYRNILYCCQRKQSHHKHFIWRYENE